MILLRKLGHFLRVGICSEKNICFLCESLDIWPEKKIILAMTGTLLLPQTRSNLDLKLQCKTSCKYVQKCSKQCFTGRWQFLPKWSGQIESRCRCRGKHSANYIFYYFANNIFYQANILKMISFIWRNILQIISFTGKTF